VKLTGERKGRGTQGRECVSQLESGAESQSWLFHSTNIHVLFFFDKSNI
jgi:hypothetical protein